ncbi:Chaperonin CPN60-2, mitochondrial [Glycine soja]
MGSKVLSVLVDVEFILFMGRNVVMEQSFGATKVTKDGVNTAKSIEFKGKVKNVSFRLVVHVANATNDVSQYQIAWFCEFPTILREHFNCFAGTTCAIVLTRAIFTEGCKSIMAVGAAVTNLKSRARMISTSEEITQGTTQALGSAILEQVDRNIDGGEFDKECLAGEYVELQFEKEKSEMNSV